MADLNYSRIVSEAFVVRYTPERSIGCGRVYICFHAGLWATEEEKAAMKKHIAGIKKAAGSKFQTKNHYGDRNTLYVGYDNCSGNELGKATAMIEFFKSHGINCSRSENGD